MRKQSVCVRACAALAVLTACAGLALIGCETAPRATEDAETAEQRQDRQAERAEAEREQMLAALRDADVMTLTAREAAQRVASKPEPGDPLVLREIKLYETLYHAAYTTNVGLITEHFVLDLPDGSPERWYPDGVDIAKRELLLHVLARLDRLNVPMRWMPADSPKPLTEPVYFPGTRKLATRLGVRLVERVEEDDHGRPRVRARLIDATAHVGGAQQYVTAVWGGERWHVTRDRAFHVW